MRTRGCVALLMAMAMVSGACSGPKLLPDSENHPESSEYRVAPPDVLWVTIRPEPDEREQVVVRPDGRITIEMIGDVQVRGKTIPEIRDAIREKIQEFVVYPTVVVELADSNSRFFHVTGEIVRPGSFPLDGDMTVLDGLLQAQGGTFVASLNGTHLARPGIGVYKIRFDDIIEEGLNETNYPLRDGDVIDVPANGFGKAGNAIRMVFLPLTSIFAVGRGVFSTVSPF